MSRDRNEEAFKIVVKRLRVYPDKVRKERKAYDRYVGLRKDHKVCRGCEEDTRSNAIRHSRGFDEDIDPRGRF